MGSLDIVREREERVGTQSDLFHLFQPGPLLLPGKHRGLHLEDFLPGAVRQHIHVLVPDVDVDGIVPVRPAQLVHELQSQHLRGLAQEPVVRLGAGQPGAVDAGLLPRADADGLASFHIADGIGLGIFQGNQRDF